MPKRKNQSKHDSMVKRFADAISEGENHTNIKADVPEYEESPKEITLENTQTGHTPDVTSEINGETLIFEIETEDSIDDSHTKGQWSLLAKYAEENSAHFIVVVPKGYKQQAETRAKKLEIKLETILEV